MTKSILAFQFIGVDQPKVSKFTSKAAAENTSNAWFIPMDEEELALNTVNAPTGGMVALYNILQPLTPVKKFSDRAVAAKRLFAVCNEVVPLNPAKETNMFTPDADNGAAAGGIENLSQKMADATAQQATARAAAAAEKARIAEEKKAAAEKVKAERLTKKAEADAAKAKAKEEKAAAAAAKKAEREANKTASGTGRASPNKGKILKIGAGVKEGEAGTLKNPRREGTFGHKSMQIIIDAGAAGILYEDFVKAGGRSNDLNWDVEHGNVVLTNAVAE